MKVMLFSIILVGMAVLLLGIRVLFVKGGKFPSHHAHQSKALRDRGVGCASDL